MKIALRWRGLVTLTALCAALLPAMSMGAKEAEQTKFPGQKLLEDTCTQCHTLASITATRDGAAGWRDKVNKMIAWGAQIRTPAETEELVQYLADAYGPSAGNMKTGVLPADSVIGAGADSSSDSLVLPPRKSADLVKAYCTMCHDLGMVVATRRSAREWEETTKLMLAKGSLAVPDDVATGIATYLSANFGMNDRRE